MRKSAYYDYPYYSQYTPAPWASTEYLRSYGYPSATPFTNVSIPAIPTQNVLRSGLQLGLLGAASGLGYSTIRSAIKKEKPSLGVGVRDTLLGALIGSTLGVLAARKSNASISKATPGSYIDVSRLIDERLAKSGSADFNKQAVLPLAAALPFLGKAVMTGFGAMGAYGAAQNAYKGVRAAGQGDFRSAAGYGGRAVGDAILSLMGARPVAAALRGIKRLRGVPGVDRLGKALDRGGDINDRLFGPVKSIAGRQIPNTGFGRFAGSALGITRGALVSTVPYAAGDAILARNQRPVPVPNNQGSSSMFSNLLRSVPKPQQPQFRTLI